MLQIGDGLPDGMSAYEKRAWRRLVRYWGTPLRTTRAPQWLIEATDSVTATALVVSGKVTDALPDGVLRPATMAIGAVVQLLDLLTATVADLHDPQKVVEHAQRRGLAVESIDELGHLDLAQLDDLLRRGATTWGLVGATEGAATGALALVPVAGPALSTTADVVAVQSLSTAIAVRITYVYGFDAADPDEREHIDRMVRRAYRQQALKSGVMVKTGRAFEAINGRQRWSQALRRDHEVIAAVERLLQTVSGSNAPVRVTQVAKALPFVAVVVGAGSSAGALRSVADQAQKYSQTRRLAEKHGLPLPAALVRREAADVEGDDGAAA